MFIDASEEQDVLMGIQNVMFTILTGVTSQKRAVVIIIVVGASNKRIVLHHMCTDQNFTMSKKVKR
jgi:type IV secretory pathway VirB2 component (pilin)